MPTIFKIPSDYTQRLATKEEIEHLARFLAHKNWLDHEKNLKTVSEKTRQIIANDFIENDTPNILELIGDNILVQNFGKYNVSIFTYSYTQKVDTDRISSVTFRVLKNEKGYALLDNEDVVFDLKQLNNQVFTHNTEKKGRPKKPKTESIQKTMEIKKYFEEHPQEYIDDICKEFGFSKTTYYRTLKWLQYRGN